MYRGIRKCYDIQLVDLHVSTTVSFILYKVRLHVSTIHVVILRSLVSFKSKTHRPNAYRSHGTLATKITTHVLMFTTTRPIRRTPIIVVLTLTHMYGGRYNITGFTPSIERVYPNENITHTHICDFCQMYTLWFYPLR